MNVVSLTEFAKVLINKNKKTTAHASKSLYVFLIPLSVNIIQRNVISSCVEKKANPRSLFFSISYFFLSTDVSNRTMTHYVQFMIHIGRCCGHILFSE